jgi:hypothetical protein
VKALETAYTCCYLRKGELEAAALRPGQATAAPEQVSKKGGLLRPLSQLDLQSAT